MRALLALLALVSLPASAAPVSWFFVVTAINVNGDESAPSNVASKLIDDVAGGSTLLTWTRPTAYTDGSPYDDPAGYRIYWGRAAGSYANSMQVNEPLATTASVVFPPAQAQIPPAITAAPALTCVPASKCLPPGTTPPPAVLVSMTEADLTPPLDELDVTVNAAADVTIALLGGNCFDWLAVGAVPGGPPTSNIVPTTPPLGATNNDGVTSPTIAVRGPFTAHADLDCTGNFMGANVTVAGVTKALVKVGNRWSVSFP